MQVRAVACAWCQGELRVAAPDVGTDGYFVLPRSCRHCSGQNIVELAGSSARASKRRRARARSTTQKIRIAALSGR